MRFLYPGSLCVTQRDIHFHSLRYGIDSFGQIDAIRYTFNIQFPAVNASRSWVWEPRPDAFPMKKIRTESVIATWAGYKKAGPLLISTD